MTPELWTNLCDIFSRFSSLKRLCGFMNDNEGIIAMQEFDIHPISVDVIYQPAIRPAIGVHHAVIGLGSFRASDLQVSHACLKSLLKHHYARFIEAAVCDFYERKHNIEPVSKSLSRFQCSSLSSEFYPCMSIRSLRSEKMPQLSQMETFPVSRGHMNMSIDYSNQRLGAFWHQEVRTGDQQRQWVSKHQQKLYASRVSPMTADKQAVAAAAKKLLSSTGEFGRLLLIE